MGIPQDLNPLSSFLKQYSRKTKFIISLSVLGLILFLSVTAAAPFKDQLFSRLYPKPKSHAQEAITNQDFVITYRGKVCSGDNCFWESVFTGDPNNLNNLVYTGGNVNNNGNHGILYRSTDAGRSWTADRIDDIANYPFVKGTKVYYGDPKLLPSNDGSFLLSSMFSKENPKGYPPLLVGGMLYHFNPTGGITTSIFQNIPSNITGNQWAFADFPKIIADPQFSKMYITADGEQETNFGVKLYSSIDKGATFNTLVINGDFVSDVGLDTDGVLYALGINGSIRRYKPPISGQYDILSSGISSLPWRVLKISSTSNKSWNLGSSGPRMVVDSTPTSPHKNRIYTVWEKEEQVIEDPNFESSKYGYNYDIFVSYSDDKGYTWSQPVKANDDTGKGDQVFPSPKIDLKGVLHIAFLDHRDNQDKAVFDIYYTSSADGISFTKNIKINEATIPNEIGGSSVGDYLDVVVPYPDRVYVIYPCASKLVGQYNIPTDACMAEIRPAITPSPIPTPTPASIGACEHPAPPPGCYYTGQDIYPACGAQLVCDGTVDEFN